MIITAATTKTERWTIADLDAFPDEGFRYEIIDGELFVSKHPAWQHQRVCGTIQYALTDWVWNDGHGIVLPAPGVVYAEDEAVAPDIVWISGERKAALLKADDPHLHESPDLVIEVLSPGRANTRRDREVKPQLYARRGVQEYWIADWRAHTLDIYLRQQDTLSLSATLTQGDTVTSPLLAGFACPLARIFE